MFSETMTLWASFGNSSSMGELTMVISQVEILKKDLLQVEIFHFHYLRAKCCVGYYLIQLLLLSFDC